MARMTRSCTKDISKGNFRDSVDDRDALKFPDVYEPTANLINSAV